MDTEGTNKNIVYVCDKHGCSTNKEGCYVFCHHTSDISHALNFKEVSPGFFMENIVIHNMENEELGYRVIVIHNTLFDGAPKRVPLCNIYTKDANYVHTVVYYYTNQSNIPAKDLEIMVTAE